ncbi:unnamed protein product [Rhizophagus irregularis]|uniref:Uncharacterized protein n=1 Tax=Rhizophagus irregularis TaxID=588596 RepID=A0A2N1MY30_9GLOM|nr:hypothetical protein RhiirC2_784631 [Rhizophagus irregularis]CAB4374919.1 unnamed protein product [Rhizophagus irregularis]CAB5368959.1 unnamed protein product [Rhizophagus irregularis]
MGSNDCSAQDYLHLSEVQVGVPMYNDDNNINYPVGISNQNSNSVPPKTFEFYLPLPDDTIFRVTYTQLHSLDTAELLNKGVDISHIPNSQFSYHLYVQSLIRQQFYQRVQQRVYQPQQKSQVYANSQVDMIPPNSQVYSNNNIYNNPSDEAISENAGYNYINYTTNYQTHNDF